MSTDDQACNNCGLRLRVEQERDLYLGLLNLSGTESPAEFIERALQLVVQVLGAQKGYLELSDPAAPDDDTVQWWTAVGCEADELTHVREGISRGIIAHALAQGQALSVSSAMLDPRFSDRKSVRLKNIGAVLCAPIGSPPLGVIYLQGDKKGPCAADVPRLELLARHLLPLCQRLFERQTRAKQDPTRGLRQKLNIEGLVGSSSAMIKLLKDVELLAPLDLSLLITGDNGTGKSQLAKVVHMNSSRRQGPFIEVNCAALQDTLLENELFGSEKGAFTGADQARAGKVAAANGGTLFLDEIGELSMTAQAKLLQLLQNKEYHTVGGTRLLRADVRVIAATNADLRQRMNEKRFRDDLFFRLEVLPLRVPNLRERREDIGELAAYFCARTLQRHVLSPVIELSPGALAELRAREWPGNIRQLENVVQAGVIRACGKRAAQVEARHLFPETYDEAPDSEPRALSFQEETRRFQRALLQRTLRETDWNVTATARRLDLARAHVYNLVNSFGLTIDRNRS